MKICLYLSNLSSGGVAKHVVELANALGENAGLEVVCLMAEKFRKDLSGKVQFISFNHSSHKLTWYGDLKLLGHLKSISADVVHAHGNASTKCLSRLRGFYNGVTCATVHWEVKRAKHKKIYNNVSGVIGVSQKVLSGIDVAKQRVIYNGVDPVALDYKLSLEDVLSGTHDPRKGAGLAIGRLVKDKGFHVLLEAWQDVDANLLIVGDGPMKAELQSLIEVYGLEERVFLLGNIPNAGRLMKSVDFSVMPSFSEGFGYVMVEALLAKRVLISTNHFGAQEVLPEELTVPANDIDALNIMIKDVLSKPDFYLEKFSDVFKWAENNLTLDAMVEQTVNFYEDLLKS